ncbi:MAG: hypothetical protein H6721_10470 [Sandaracinus sp.]|nr:hypothetical protein [Sandaracinus sp.]MCB9632542.1 hypothetical protein [Sandaracinus sp.]
MLRSSRLFWLVGAVVLLGTGCPGDLKDPQRFPATPLPECAGNIDVVADIFERRCGTDSCHAGDEPAADLNLLDGNAFEHLMAVPATQCEGRVRVDPDDVINSFLLDKLRGPEFIPPNCGDPMPFLSRLNGNEIACVERWILENLMEADGGMPTPRDGGGTEEDGGTTPTEDAGVDAGEMMSDPCGPIEGAGRVLCMRSATGCSAVFTMGGTSCDEVCALAGLTCTAAYADADDGTCTFDMATTVTCDNDDGGMSDHCVCGSL